MRLIDADSVIENVSAYIEVLKNADYSRHNEDAGMLEDFLQDYVEAAIPVDPVHAAGGCYCCECKHWDENPDTMGCFLFGIRTRKNDFCSRGVKKEEQDG